MGMLRLAGAVGGAGQGMATVGAEMQKERMLHLETAREMALMGLRAQYEREQQGREFNFQHGEHTQEQTAAAGRTETEQKGATERNTATNSARAAEGAANRSAAAARTHEIVEGRENAAKIHAAGSKKSQSRFAFDKTTQPQTVTKEGITGGGQMPIVHDRLTGNTFQQVGTKFILQGVDPKSFSRPLSGPQQQSMQAAEQNLMDHPETEGDFLSKYRYLPAQFVNSRPQMSVSQPAGAQGTESATDGDEYEQNAAENEETYAGGATNPADNEPAVEPGTPQ